MLNDRRFDKHFIGEEVEGLNVGQKILYSTRDWEYNQDELERDDLPNVLDVMVRKKGVRIVEGQGSYKVDLFGEKEYAGEPKEWTKLPFTRFVDIDGFVYYPVIEAELAIAGVVSSPEDGPECDRFDYEFTNEKIVGVIKEDY